MRDQIFSTVCTLDFFINFLVLWTQGLRKPGIIHPKYFKVRSKKTPSYNTFHIFQPLWVCSSLRGSCLPPRHLSKHLWAKILFFTSGICPLCYSNCWDHPYLHHPARHRETSSQSPLRRQTLLLPGSSGTRSPAHSGHLLPLMLWPVAHKPLVDLDLFFNSLVPSHPCNPTLDSSIFCFFTFPTALISEREAG